jgi:hypothetical protein
MRHLLAASTRIASVTMVVLDLDSCIPNRRMCQQLLRHGPRVKGRRRPTQTPTTSLRLTAELGLVLFSFDRSIAGRTPDDDWSGDEINLCHQSISGYHSTTQGLSAIELFTGWYGVECYRHPFIVNSRGAGACLVRP